MSSTNLRLLLPITAVLEALIGVALIAAPSVVVMVLLGAGLEGTVAESVARIAGVALLSLAVGCWLTRKDEGGRGSNGVVAGMLVYNCGVVAVLAYAAVGAGVRGFGLWPAVILHLAFAAWCLASLLSRQEPRSSAATPNRN